MKHEQYQICTNCIMDTSDPNITFNNKGECDYCQNFQSNILPNWRTDERGHAELMRVAEKIKKSCKDKEFDCILGLSGGLDSSYTAYVTKEVMGLRPLLLHVDAGWNTDKAVGNIEKLVNGLGLELYTEVINWEEMKDLQKALLRSQIADQDIPQDTAFFSALYKFARKYKIKYVLTGGNYSTECCREPDEWGAYPGIDKTLIRDIHARFGTVPLKTFPLVDIMVYKLYYKYILGMEVFRPLNCVPYIKKDAEAKLGELFGWENFSTSTMNPASPGFMRITGCPVNSAMKNGGRIFSSLIMTGQMTRDKALERIAKPEMDEHFLRQEFEYVANKLDLTVAELEEIFRGKNKTYQDYKNKYALIGIGAKVMQKFGLERRLFR